MKFAAFLKAERQKRGLNQDEMADLLQAHQSEFSRWERGFIPGVRILRKIVKILKIPPAQAGELLFGDDE